MVTRKLLYTLVAVMMVISLALAACGPAEEPAAPNNGADEPDTPEKLILALVPSQNAETLLDNAKPLADKLTEKLGIPVEAKVPLDYNAVVEGLDAGTIDIAMLNSFGYVLSNELSGTKCILKSVRYGSATYHGQFVVMADSGIESLEDLEGKRIAFVDPGSTSGYIFAANTLKAHGIDPEQMDSIFAGGHDSAIIALLNEQVDVAVSFDDARGRVEGEFPDVMETTKIIGYTDEIPNDTVSVRADLGDELIEQIKQAFLDIASTDEGHEIIYSIYEIDGFEPAEDSEYDPVRAAAEALGLDLEEMMGN